MGAVLLDTTVLIDVLRGVPRTTERVRQVRAGGDTLYTCAVIVEEVTRGLRPSEASAADVLFRALRPAPIGRSEGELAGAWRRDFAAQGRTLSQADCLIAAAAFGVSARLVTGNPEDFPMPDLPVDTWPPGG